MEIIAGIKEELEKMKFRDIHIIDKQGVSIIADYFIITTADSIPQIEGIREKLKDHMWKYKIPLKNPLERWEDGWLLLDFGDYIIHVFLEEKRNFYNIDSLIEHGSDEELSKIMELK